MRLFVLIGGLIVLALFAALIGPYFVDWGNYRDRFEAEASRVLGQEVRVEGAASARFLPFPSVTFSDVRVGAPGETTITVEEFSMDAELSPFLRGEILIFDMRLVSPVVRLDVDEQGRPIWQWPSTTPIDPAQITLESATFTDGTLILRDRQDNRQWDFNSLNGTAAADSLFGPWRISGEGLVRGVPFEASIALGNLNRSGFSTRINAELPSSNIALSANGRIAPPNDEIEHWYSGTFNLKPIDKTAGEYRLEGLFEADARSLSVEQFRGDFGSVDDPYTINGSGEIVGGASPRFVFEAKGNQLSFSADDQTENAQSFSERLTSFQTLLASLPFPPIPGAVNLDLPAIVAGKTTIRDVKLIASPSAGAASWVIDHAEAKLPGRTLVEANGVLALKSAANIDSENTFTGALIVASRQPSGLASWLTTDVDEIIRLLPNAGFSANVVLSENKQSFSELEIILGNATLSGSIERNSDDESLPFIDIDLAGKSPNFETIDALSKVMLGSGGAFRLADHDVDLKLDLTNADIGGLKLGHINSAMRIRGERTEIDRLSIDDIFGASVSATGTMLRSVGENGPGYTINWDAGLVATEGAQLANGFVDQFKTLPFFETLFSAVQLAPQAFDDVNLNSVGSAIIPATGNTEASASISGTFGGSDISLTSTINGALSKVSEIIATVSGTIENKEATTLLSQAGFEVFPLRLLGNGLAKINMSGSLDEGLSARFALETDDSVMSTDGIFRAKPTGISFTGLADLKSADIEPWFDLFGYIFPNTGLGTDASAKARIEYDNKTYQLTDIAGQIAGNTFSGELNSKMNQGTPKLTGSFELGDLDLTFLASILTGRYDLSNKEDLFSDPLYADHSLDFKIKAQNFGTENLGMEDANLRLIYRDGSLSLNDITARMGKGTIAGSVDVQNSDGSVLLNGLIAAKKMDVAQLVPAFSGNLNADGDATLSITGNGKTIEALLGSLTGSGVLKVKDFILPNIDVYAFDSILSRADEFGYQITDAQIVEIAQSETAEGNMNVPATEVPLSLSSGVLQANNISVEEEGTSLSGDLAFDLKNNQFSGQGKLTYNAGDEAVAGSPPEIGFVLSQSNSESDIQIQPDFTLLTSFLRQRALEREQARVEALQARLLEKQRLRREVRYLKYQRREKQLQNEEKRTRLAASERRLALIEAQKRAAEIAVQEAKEKARMEAEAAKRKELERLEKLKTAPIIKVEPNVDDGLVEPVPQGGAIFENLELQLGVGN